MNYWYGKIGRYSVFMEWRGCTRGKTYLDWMREGHNLHLWIGSLCVLFTWGERDNERQQYTEVD